MARLAKPPIISAIAMPISVLVSLINRTESCRNTHLLLLVPMVLNVCLRIARQLSTSIVWNVSTSLRTYVSTCLRPCG